MASVLGRIIRNGNGSFGLVELSESKTKEILDKAIQMNIAILEKTMIAVGRWLQKNQMYSRFEQETELLLAVYDNVSLKISNLLALELAKQIREVKENGEG